MTNHTLTVTTEKPVRIQPFDMFPQTAHLEAFVE